NAGDALPATESHRITVGRSRGRSRSPFLRLWVREPRMRMVSIAIGLVSGNRGQGRGRRNGPDAIAQPSEAPGRGQTGAGPVCAAGVAGGETPRPGPAVPRKPSGSAGGRFRGGRAARQATPPSGPDRSLFPR